MSVRVAVNGLGRTGRSFLRSAYERQADIELVAVNDLADATTVAHLLKYDSAGGGFPGDVAIDGDMISINDRPIRAFAETDPAELPWGELDVDVVIESTGHFRTRAAAARHLEAGARKVIISAPAKGDEPPDATVVLGVNFETAYDPERHHIISNASCTTNCLAPVAKVLHDTFGIRHGLMTTCMPTQAIRCCSTVPTRTCAGPARRRSTSCPRQPARPRRWAWSSPSSPGG